MTIEIQNPKAPTRMNDGHLNVVTETVSPVEFVNYNVDDRRSECIHVVPPSDPFDREIELIRLVSETSSERPFDRVRTVIDASFNVRYPRSDAPRRRPDSICLHNDDADTLLTWLRALIRERSDATVSIAYWEQNNSPLIEDAGLNQESLFLDYKTESGTEHRVNIHGVYANHVQMMANFD